MRTRTRRAPELDDEERRKPRETSAAPADELALRPEDVEQVLSGSPTPRLVEKLQPVLGNRLVGNLLHFRSSLAAKRGKKAVTVDGEIHLSEKVGADEAREVVAHELVHVVQQTRPGGRALSPQALEAEAQLAGRALSAGQTVEVLGRSPAGSAQGYEEASPEPEAAGISPDLARALEEAIEEAGQTATLLGRHWPEAAATLAQIRESLSLVSAPLISRLSAEQAQALLEAWEAVAEAETGFVDQDAEALNALQAAFITFLKTLAALALELLAAAWQPRAKALVDAAGILAGLIGGEVSAAVGEDRATGEQHVPRR